MSAWPTNYRRAVFKNVSGVCVNASAVLLNRPQHGIDQREVQDLVELMLRVVGVQVATEDEARELNWPTLHLIADTVSFGAVFTFNFVLSHADNIEISRNGARVKSHAWGERRYGWCMANNFVQTLRSEFSIMITAYCNDLLAGNPGFFIAPGRVAQLTDR